MTLVNMSTTTTCQAAARRVLRRRGGGLPWSIIGKDFSSAASRQSNVYDYIIVGAGSAGCVLANRLSANPRVRVLLLEAGNKGAFFINIPVGYLWSIGNPKVDWMFKTQPVPGLGGRSLLYPRGKVLGGCSSINGMIYMRGQARDYDEWAKNLEDDRWSWKKVLPIFQHSEDHHQGDKDPEMHGVGGEWRVEKQRLSWDILDAVQDACVEVRSKRGRIMVQSPQNPSLS